MKKLIPVLIALVAMLALSSCEKEEIEITPNLNQLLFKTWVSQVLVEDSVNYSDEVSVQFDLKEDSTWSMVSTYPDTNLRDTLKGGFYVNDSQDGDMIYLSITTPIDTFSGPNICPPSGEETMIIRSISEDRLHVELFEDYIQEEGRSYMIFTSK